MDVRRKDYFGSEAELKSLTNFPLFPRRGRRRRRRGGGGKLVYEINMVYDATQLGLNGAVWAPWFAMPTIDSHFQAVEAGKFMADCDVGTIFLNFMLKPPIRSHTGVDLSNKILTRVMVS